MRTLNYINKVTGERTTSFEKARNWKEREIFFTDVNPLPKGTVELKEEEEAKEKNKGKKIRKKA